MKRKVCVFLLIVFIGVAFVACSDANDPNDPNDPDMGASKNTELKNYGNGVYYFPYTRDFGNELSLFVENNPNLRLVSIAPLDIKGYGNTTGYYVYFEPKVDSR